MLDKVAVAYFYPVFIFILATMLFLTALTQLSGAFYQLSVDTVLSQLSKGQNPVEQELLESVDATKKRIQREDKPLYRSNLNRLLFYQAKQKGLFALSSRKIHQEAESNLKKALSYSPVDSLLWFKLARTHFLQKSISDKTIDALLLSIMTGSHELGYLLLRLDLCMQVFEQFKNKDKNLLRSQILIAWKKSPKLFLQKIASKKQNRDNVRILLHNSYPHVLEEMELSFEKLSE